MDFRKLYNPNSKIDNKTISSLSRFNIKKIPLYIVTIVLLLESLFYHITPVYAMADPDPLIQGALFTVIEGGADTTQETIINNVVRSPFIFGSEIDSGFALESVAKAHYWDEMNATIRYKIQAGTLTNDDVGYVYYKQVNGENIPVAVVHSSVFGANEYLITEELAQKIIDEQLTDDAEVQQAVLDYWERVYISDTEPFIEMASDIKNWTFKWTNEMSETAKEVFDNIFGQNLQDPASSFFEDGTWITCITPYDQVYRYSVGDSYINPEFDYVVIHCADIGNEREGYYLWYYDPDWMTYYYQRITDITPYQDYFQFKNVTPGFKTITVSFERYNEMMDPNLWPRQIGFTELFPNWDGLARMNPNPVQITAYQGLLNVDDATEAVEALALAAETAPQPNPDGIPTFNPDPEYIPEMEPLRNPEPIINPGVNKYPSINPGGAITPPSGGGNSGDGGGGDNGDDDRPELRIPDLLGLFPFCIPFDIKNAITLFSDGGDWTQPEAPTFDIPFNIDYGGRNIVSYTFHLDLSDYDIWVALGYIRMVEVIAFIIILAIATSRVLF